MLCFSSKYIFKVYCNRNTNICREMQKFTKESDRYSKALEISIRLISNTGEFINFSIKAREIFKLEKKFKGGKISVMVGFSGL